MRSVSAPTSVMKTGRRERRWAITASSSRAQGTTLFQPPRCSSRWKSPLATHGSPALATQEKSWRAVEELEAVHASRELRIACKPLCEPARVRCRLVVERMRRDERGAGQDGRLDRLVDAAVDGDEAAEPERQRMGGEARVGVVVGELEARHHEQSVLLARPRSLALELGEVGVEAVGGDAVRRVAAGLDGSADVVGDAEDVEPVRAVEIHERRHRQDAVAPGRVRVQLCQQCSRACTCHVPIVGAEDRQGG